MHSTPTWPEAISEAIKPASKQHLCLLLALILTLFAAPAEAGDYSHQCRSSDGAYAMNDEELRVFDAAKGQETGPSITYEVLNRIELSKHAGYCVARNAPPGQQRFAYEGTTYALHIAFRQHGENVKLFMLCDRASSGLPATYNCDRDVKTLEWHAGAVAGTPKNTSEPPPNSPRWLIDGSEVEIVASGANRRIVYVKPNAAATGRGISAGDVLFEGRRNGDRYVGKMQNQTRGCGTVAFDVSGRVEIGERQVILTGLRPLQNKACRTIDRRAVRLVFERQ